MIIILLLCIVQLSTADPRIKDKESMMLALDGIEGMMYDMPGDYEDPGLIEYEMSAIGSSPVLSLLQMAKKQTEDKDKFIPAKEKYALAKETVDEVITRLQTIRSRLDSGNGEIHYSDLEKSIDSLKKLERSIRPNINYLLSALRQTMTISKPKSSHILEVRTIPTKRPESPRTERPVLAASEEALAPIALTVVEPKFTEAPTTTEHPIPSTVVPEEEVRAPSAMEVYKSHKTEFKKYDGEDGKAAYPSKWTWKSSSFV